jgi:S-adenosyl methyltransferase
MIRPSGTTNQAGLDSQAPPSAPDLASLRAAFPRYRLWREDICGRIRYIAISQQPGLHPHTFVTADLAEMQTALEPSQHAVLIPFSTAKPSISRMYSFLLGGKDHLAADRSAARVILRDYPEVALTAADVAAGCVPFLHAEDPETLAGQIRVQDARRPALARPPRRRACEPPR